MTNYYSSFRQKFKDGLLEITKDGESFTISIKQFNKETGEEIDPIIITTTLTATEADRSDAYDVVEEIDAVIAEMRNLEV